MQIYRGLIYLSEDRLARAQMTGEMDRVDCEIFKKAADFEGDIDAAELLELDYERYYSLGEIYPVRTEDFHVIGDADELDECMTWDEERAAEVQACELKLTRYGE